MLDSARPAPVSVETTGSQQRGPDERAGLLAFARLDALLADGVAAARLRYGAQAAADSFRGLYLSDEQVSRGLLDVPGLPLAATISADGSAAPEWPEIMADNPRWRWVRDRYALSDRELDILLLAVGPDVDRRYERLYGYLQDDVSARRPTVDLALGLLTTSPAERLGGFPLFASDAPLVRERLIALRADPRAEDPPLIARLLAVDEQITAALLGLDGLDRRLTPFCTVTGGSLPRLRDLDDTETERVRSLAALVRQYRGRGPFRLCFHGPVGSGRRRTTDALAARLGVALLTITVPVLAEERGAVPERLALAFRDAELRGALVYLNGADALLADTTWPGRDALAAALAAYPGVVVLATGSGWSSWADEPLGVLDVAFTRPAPAVQRALWERAVTAVGAVARPTDVAAVGDRFRLSARQIQDAALAAAAAARLRLVEEAAADDPPAIATGELFSAARRQSGHDLAALARRIRPVHRFDDLVLPPEALGQLRELAARVEHRSRVMDDWGFDAKLATGKGISALFTGPPGTGKTMAASVIAAELGLDLFAVDLSTVVSKYIGETEKNLERVFSAAAESDAILFFDEADALFGKRSDVREAHDRYANMEIAYLLQRMEQYEGLAVLATNLRDHLDDAFTRRLQVVVEFPFPDVAERSRIWRSCLPAAAPLDPDVDLADLARYRLAGGNIKNVVLGAAFLAAAQGVPIGRRHLLDASRREHQKMGKVVVDLEPEST